MEIKPLTSADVAQMPAIIFGYQTHEIYALTYHDDETETAVGLRLQQLPQPFNKRFDPLEASDLAHYQTIAAQGFSFGLFNHDLLLGVALAEWQQWNNSLWVWEFHIATGYHGQGWGRLLMTRLIAQAQTAGIRTVVCETQNSNVPAIRFYRRLGFRLEGIDISYYDPANIGPTPEVALFMKRSLPS